MQLPDLNIFAAQINPLLGDLKGNARMICQLWRDAPAGTDLILVPELALTGYPLEDLVLKPGFLRDVITMRNDIVHKSKSYPDTALLLSLPLYDDQMGVIYNGVELILNGRIIATQYKHHLPNYGVFDEKRVFAPGPLPSPIEFKNWRLGILICEDMWQHDVAAHLAEKGAELLLSINASPYDFTKAKCRQDIARMRSLETKLPLLYVNLVGGQDEIVFDGGSFIATPGGITSIANYFAPDMMEIVAQKSRESESGGATLTIQGQGHEKGAETPSSEDDMLAHMYQACMLGLKDYLHKNGQKDVLIGLSGGIDSALTAAIAVDALGGDHVRCVMMPSPFTSQESLDCAAELAKNLGVAYDIFPISDAMDGVAQAFTDHLHQSITGLAHENMQSRLRGLTLMTLSNMTGALVISTGNKSEMAMGYATLYGDMCGGFSVLKDMYKHHVFALSQWRNAHIPPHSDKQITSPIPQFIIDRPPSAELRDNQRDDDTLPPYDILDDIIRLIIEEDAAKADILNLGYAPDIIDFVWAAINRNEYKRRQSCPGVKLTPRNLSRDRRYPMTNGYA